MSHHNTQESTLKALKHTRPPVGMTSTAPPTASSSNNVRRPPANRSVSLLHSSRPRPPISETDQGASSSDSQEHGRLRVPTGRTRQPPSSLIALARDSSGESSNAEKWFEKSNNEVRDDSASFANNDSPFFMRNSSSPGTPPDGQQPPKDFLVSKEGSASLPLRTGLLQLGTDGSSTEDFRSVIDDLTIQNKKLKRRLKKYEKLQDSHLRDEKLFEVRIHGLPAAKKRELEETLRNFASSLRTEFPLNGYDGLLLPRTSKATSSQTSLQNPDSAYASMSASGQGSSAQSVNDGKTKSRYQTAAARRQNIHSYLHHIPEGLLPQPTPENMTERAKKKKVVRRLEQIFAGKGAAVGGHHHPMQQQEVSQSAARADRVTVEGQGPHSHLEGNREAPILLREMEDPADPQAKHGSNSISPDDNSSGSHPEKPTMATQQVSGERLEHLTSTEQRPTRPLDLDPHRAQVPAENIRYMRHLGFSPPYPEMQKSPEDNHGWVYLNLLINMAQLHTLNVTAEFVRSSLADHSAKLEVSQDGCKVRWKGGRSVTRTSSDDSSHDRAVISTPDGESPRKRPKLSHHDTERSEISTDSRSAFGTSWRKYESGKLVYTSLFFHKDETDNSDSSSEDEDAVSNLQPVPAAGDSSGITSVGQRITPAKRKKQRDDGPIIFYSNARFCTDLSGDHKPIGNNNAPPYNKLSATPIGHPPVDATWSSFEKRGPLASAAQLPEPMDLHDNPIPESMELSFPPHFAFQPSDKTTMKPFDMEVTGIGGVWPTDNFAIAVESRRALVDHGSAPGVSREAHRRSIPTKFDRILHPSGSVTKSRLAVREDVVSTDRKDLPPSRLPPALAFMPLDGDSTGEDGDEDEDEDDEMSVGFESPDGLPPATAPQPVDLHYTSSDEDEDDDDESDDDGSLDLLASARQADPEAIRAKEREYDANMAERLAEDIPAGSSAATAGGGSSYASPASAMKTGEHRRAVQEARAAARLPVNPNRSTTTDSMKTQGPGNSSPSDGESDDD